MKCSSCGTENENGFKFCVKCGSSLDPRNAGNNVNDLSYEQVDRGNYHSEEEFSDNGGYTMSSGTFTIRDAVPRSEENDLYTSDELNSSEEEFDFSIYDEPKTSPMPSPTAQPPMQQSFGQGMQIPPMQMQMPQPNGGMASMGQQPVMYRPQIMGYDPSGKPIYGQPVMYQPQIMGYDPSGKPIYGQPVMYQPQIMGYDPSGKPIYGQPMMYQPPIMGYDPSGMPIYGQSPNMQGNMPNMPQTAAEQPKPEPEPQKGSAVSQEDKEKDFWAFFGESDRPASRGTSDEEAFFGRSHSKQENDDHFADPFADLDRRHKEVQAAKKIDYMSDTPIVDGDKLKKNVPDKINKLYMRPTGAPSHDLTVGSGKHRTETMAETKEVDGDKLASALKVRSRISMQISDTADADDLEAYTPKKRKEYMAQADHAVEAMPKRKNPYESELDRIELPEYMKARRSRREETAEIPPLPKTGSDH